MNAQEIAGEVRATDAAMALPGVDGDASVHLLDRLESFLDVLSFLPVSEDADAALRARFAAAAIELIQTELEEGTEAAAQARRAWRMLDSLADYFETKSGTPPRCPGQTAGMNRLLREVAR